MDDNASFMAFYDPMDDGKSEPRSLADLLCSEIGFENPFQRCGIHPGTRIGNRQFHVCTRRNLRHPDHRRRIHHRGAEFYGEYALVIHRIRRVGAEIQDYLVDLRGVNDGHSPPNILTDLDGRGKRSPEQLDGLLDYRTEFDRFPILLFPLAAEGQDLLDEVSGPMGGVENLFQTAPKRMGLTDVCQPHLAIAENDSKNVVEIMGNPAGQRADGFHLLGLPQLGLDAQPFLLGDLTVGDVLGYHEHAPAAVQLYDFNGNQGAPDLPGPGPNMAFEIAYTILRCQYFEKPLSLLHLGPDLQIYACPVKDFLPGESKKTAERIIGLVNARLIEGSQGKRLRAQLEERLELVLAFP